MDESVQNTKFNVAFYCCELVTQWLNRTESGTLRNCFQLFTILRWHRHMSVPN